MQSRTPKLRFKEFTDEWQEKKLGDFSNSISSGKSSTINESNGRYPIFGSMGRIGATDKAGYSGDKILVARVGANAGAIYRVSGEYAVSDNTLILDLKKTIDGDFAYLVLQKTNLNRLVFGSGQPLVTGGQLKSLKVITPDIKEQQKIAGFLTAVDEKIGKLEEKKKRFEKYKKGVMQAIFSQKIRFQKPDGSNYPDWEEMKLGEYIVVKTKRNSKSEVELVLSVNNKKGFIAQSEQFEDHRVASKEVQNYKIVDRGNFAYNPSRINIGSLACLKSFDQGIVSPMYVVFELKKGLITEFFESLVRTHRFRHLVKIGCSGSVRDSLNFDDLKEFKLKIPSATEQTRIAEFLMALDNKINLINNQLEQTKLFKKSLLQQMFV